MKVANACFHVMLLRDMVRRDVVLCEGHRTCCVAQMSMHKCWGREAMCGREVRAHMEHERSCMLGESRLRQVRGMHNVEAVMIVGFL